jgi:tripartite motif-containing protein 71
VTARPIRFVASPRGALRRVLSLSLVVATIASLSVTAFVTSASASDPLTFVGMIGRPRLNAPEGVAVDASGDVYVTDPNVGGTTVNDQLIKFSADGTFLDVIAGPGPGTGPVVVGKVYDPTAVAVAPNGDVFVLERYSNSVNRVQRFDGLGNYVTTWGAYGTGNGQFVHPKGIAVDSLGNVYVADTGNDRIQEFDDSGNLLTQWSTTNPTGVAVDSSDVIYVAGNNNIYRFNTSGAPLTSWALAGAVGVAVDGANNIWVTTTGNAIKKYDNLGATLLGTYGSGVLSAPQSISIAPGGKVYVADTGNGRVQRFSSAGVAEIEWGEYPGSGVPDVPTGIAVDSSDNVYMTKKATDQIQKFDVDGNLLAEFGGTGNTNGKLNDPGALAVGPDGNLYVADTTNQRIQKLDTSGGYLLQWGNFGTNDGQVADPAGIAVSAGGNVYVADTGNNRIQEFSASGTFIRTWGVFGTEDGNFKTPKGITIDGSGNVWVADSGNNRIQKFSPTGTFLAKWGSSGSGDGGLSGPSDLAIDAEGTVWVVDKGHNRLQRFTTAGAFLSKLGGVAIGLDTGQFSVPLGIAIDSTGRILVTDSANNRVQVFEDKNGPDTTITGPAASTPFSTASFSFTANEPGANFHCKLDGGVYVSCTSLRNYSGLVEGPHIFYAYATDTRGFDGNPTQYPWTIDTTPPTASITAKPASPTGSTTASFSFTSNEPGSKFQYYRDTGSWGPTSPTSTASITYNSLGNGSHTFHVRAVDPAGNVSQPVSYSWVIDTTPPTISITSGPSGYVQSTSANFAFSSGDGTATFQCKLDGGSYASCASPVGFSSLPPGQHTFYVYATDNLGNQSAPAHKTWTVDTQTHRPDNQIATGTTYVGNDIYNANGTNQTKSLKAQVGKTVTFKIRVENDGSGTDPLTVLGGGSAKGYSVTYFSGTTNITSKVVAGTYKLSLGVGASLVLRMTVKVGSSAVVSRSILVTTSADHEPTRLDAVKAVVKRA